MQDFTEENNDNNLRNVDSIDGQKGHGTGVASVLAGDTFGVAKGVTLHSLKVLDQFGRGELSDVLAAINTVKLQYSLPAVVNMSLGYGYPNSSNGMVPLELVPLQTAINNLISEGVTIVAAAGNDSIENCMLPAGFTNVISVGATGYDSTIGYNDNRRWEGHFFGSNFGDCVDIYAPGENIETNTATNNSSTDIISGTSFSSPQVAGAAALYLQNHPFANPNDVKTAIFKCSNKKSNRVSICSI